AEEFPSQASRSATIRVVTKNGSTVIGTKQITIQLSAAASQVPTFTSVSLVEATPDLATVVGALVQGLTTLSVDFTGAAGVYGSTITEYKLQVGSQTFTSSGE